MVWPIGGGYIHPDWSLYRHLVEGKRCSCGGPAFWFFAYYHDYTLDRWVCDGCLEDFLLLKALEG